jgi:hypothetical protein
VRPDAKRRSRGKDAIGRLACAFCGETRQFCERGGRFLLIMFCGLGSLRLVSVLVLRLSEFGVIALLLLRLPVLVPLPVVLDLPELVVAPVVP